MSDINEMNNDINEMVEITNGGIKITEDTTVNENTTVNETATVPSEPEQNETIQNETYTTVASDTEKPSQETVTSEASEAAATQEASQTVPEDDPYNKYARPDMQQPVNPAYYGYMPQGQPYMYQQAAGYPDGQAPAQQANGQQQAPYPQPAPYGWVPQGYYAQGGYFIPGQQFQQANNAPVKQKKQKKGSGKVGRFFFGVAMAALFGIIAGAVFIGITYFYKEKNPELFETQKTTARVTVSDNSRLNLSPSEDTVQIPATDVIEGNVSTLTSTDVSGVVETSMPSIVSIDCVTRVYNSFYGTYETPTAGSGIIIQKSDTELMIATNNHVVEDSTSISITFNDGTSAKAAIKGKDDVADLAVVAVKLEDLSADTLSKIAIAKIGNSDDVKIGELAIAIGNSLGYGQSVTVGYISAKDREITIDGQTYSGLLQTDAAINPGNSGGALMNLKGELIGINNAKVGGTNVEGIGYAIPISRAQAILEDFAARETLTAEEQGFMGVTISTVTEAISKAYNWPEGVYISSLYENGAAEKAGMMVGDIITAIDGVTIKTDKSLVEKIQSIRYGQEITVTLQRLVDGEFKELEFKIVLEKRPADVK
ncbi:MAG: trypsin-like peptidase domain-containing protein [Lachnospiraceae bacterium]|nr:trypsin-like peptidase domain-containing protein [Lachnospiraceae bacterium]